jgi:hypothetical protein
VVNAGGKQTCFDAHIMVDWNSGNGLRPHTPAANAPWVGEGWWNGNQLVLPTFRGYFRSRRSCIAHLLCRLRDHVNKARRVLLCFDFAYGYPAGYGRALGLAGPRFWNTIWDEISVPSLARGKAGPAPMNVFATRNNKNNRFVIASHLNQRVANHHALGPPGPLYGCPDGKQTQFFMQANPGFPFQSAGGALQHFRMTEQRLLGLGFHPLCVWWVLGGGAPVVGGQILSGIPSVRRIWNHRRFVSISKVWPFETGFVLANPPTGPYIVHAEIWPDIVNNELQRGPIRDEAQVRAMVQWAATEDAVGQLATRFQQPSRLTTQQIQQCEHQEGWILGA